MTDGPGPGAQVGTPFQGGVLAEAVSAPASLTGDGLTDLMAAILSVAGELESPAVLERLVQVSAELTGARYGAINVLDAQGASVTFVSTGVPTALARVLAQPPHAQGLFGQIPETGALRLDDLTHHPAFRGWPDHLPPMGTFLGATVRVRDEVFGQLYLSEKLDGTPFSASDERTIVALAAAAGVAVANAQLYAQSARREHWLQAGQEITTMLLEGIDEEEALEHIAHTAKEVSDADAAALALPGLDDELLVELADGDDADRLLGLVMPEGGRAWTVQFEGKGSMTPSLFESLPENLGVMHRYGPAMFAPLQTSGRGVGVLILLRRIGRPPFEEGDLATAESFAAQAALAYVLAEARHAQDVAALLDERERIARDLHDLAIQQLFATGMQLETVRRRAEHGIDPQELTAVVEEALDNVDESVRQIRHIVYELRDPDAATGLVERLRREASLARTGLGFAPSLVILLDGAALAADDADTEYQIDERLDAQLTDDVVAVVREGLANAARHAQASSVRVRVTVTGKGPQGTVTVEVQDDGVGLPPVRVRSSGTGNLATRARQHRGSFSLTAPPDDAHGALLTWQAPLS
ncbi:MAG: GAF domain-containing protein [Micrococcales bacterium]|nr:GAF domain-containing protein [Micrococcales bacterium]